MSGNPAQQRSRGRPSRAVVTREKIAAAALDVASGQGYGKLTMSAVARRLGVAPSALYNHLAGKDELLVLLEDAVMAQVDTAALQRCLAGEIPAAQALALWARSYRDVFSAHAPLIAHIATMPITGTRETTQMYERLAAVLASAGVDAARILDTIVAFESFIFGSAYDVSAPADIFAVPEQSLVDAPSLRRALQQRAPGAGGVNPYADQAFELGLGLLIDGAVGHGRSSDL